MNIISKSQNETKVEINGQRFAFRNSDGWVCWMAPEVDPMELKRLGHFTNKNYRAYSHTRFFFAGYKNA